MAYDKEEQRMRTEQNRRSRNDASEKVLLLRVDCSFAALTLVSSLLFTEA